MAPAVTQAPATGHQAIITSRTITTVVETVVAMEAARVDMAAVRADTEGATITEQSHNHSNMDRWTIKDRFVKDSTDKMCNSDAIENQLYSHLSDVLEDALLFVIRSFKMCNFVMIR